MLHVLLLWAEGEAADAGCSPSAPITRSKVRDGPRVKSTRTPLGGVGQRGGSVAESVLGALAAALVEHPGEVAAVDLDVAASELGRQLEDQLAVLVNAAHRAAMGLDGAQLVLLPPSFPARRGGSGRGSRPRSRGAQRWGDLDDGGVGTIPG